MIIETSALVAIVRDEPEAAHLAAAIYSADVNLTSAASLLEDSIVLLLRGGEDAVRALDELVAEMRIAVFPFDDEQAYRARDAYRTFGKGTGHGASRNFGDCFSYALAKTTGEPLLCTGSDFARTDLPMVAWQ